MPPKYRSLHPHPYLLTAEESRAEAEKIRRAHRLPEIVPGASYRHIRAMTKDPRDPEIDRWLRSIEPRQELAVRYAMRERFPAIRADRKFTARIDEIRASLNPTEEQLAMILADARAIAGRIEELL